MYKHTHKTLYSKINSFVVLHSESKKCVTNIICKYHMVSKGTHITILRRSTSTESRLHSVHVIIESNVSN